MIGRGEEMADGGRDAIADRLQQLLARRLRGEQVTQLALFTHGLVGRGGSLIETLDEEAAAALAWSSFQFYRGPGAVPRVRVVAPTYVSDGWDAPITLLETVIADRPFVVDTIQAALAARGLSVRAIVHPIFAVRRDETGAVEQLRTPRDGDQRESFVQVALPRTTDPAVLAALEQEIRDRLADVTLVTDDFPLMLARAQQVASELDQATRRKADQRGVEATVTAEFLRWLVDGGFVFLGYREYALTDVAGVPTLSLRAGSGLGLLRREEAAALVAPRALSDLPERVREWLTGPALLTMDKTVAAAPVHRRERMDNIGVKEFDASGRVIGERRFVGLLTSKAHRTESSEVPLLRRVLRQVLAAEGVVAGSHDHKAIVEIFDGLPKGELFTASAADVRADIRTVMAARLSSDVVISVRERPQRATVLIVMPAARFSGVARHELDRLVATHVGGQLLDADLVVGAGDRIQLHYAFTPGPTPLGADGERALRDAIGGVLRSWPERLGDALASVGVPQVAARWATAFPTDYQANTSVSDAVADVRLVATATAAAPALALSPTPGAFPSTTLRAVTVGTPLVLADVMPILDGFGLRVLGDDTVILHPANETACFLHTFRVQDRQGRALDHVVVGPRLTAAIRAVISGRAEADVLNRLVLEAGLDLLAVQALRAYAGWVVQAGLATRTAVRTALTTTPVAAARLFDHLAARFRPGAVVGAERAAFVSSLDAVASLRDDAIFRGLLDAVDATVRTNAFTRRVEDVVSCKLTSALVPWLPAPVPLFEIYVFGQRVEGVHLRAGRIARGGIRASDRPDDLRTEVLALMKTQTVKNAVIVPTGAKGGFVVRGAADARPTREEIVAAYRTFIAALLDLTDNVVGERVVSPAELSCYDEDDPYLVVAADKGTATFSDTANALAAERAFWLGDAFASGGSAGFDHKALGITARGTWECVRIHAHSLGLDADTAPLRVAGIGDPSGDVFGNGLLQSTHVRLVAAFNHQHVFLDPEPDPARSAAERRRLFDGGWSWSSYDPACLSPGGQIVERSAKHVLLSPQVRELLGLTVDGCSGEALVRAVLSLDVDLLFNGGIGTYVKAARESQLAVGDPTNDTVRVDASAVRARIIAEGGNLGLTQAARIELALAGRLLNTDAIDNSAGVDCSDHEVNLKICLAAVLAAGGIDRTERDAILTRVTPDVVERVLRHNRRQGRLLGLDQRRSRQRVDALLALQLALEDDGLLDRVTSGLPDPEVLRARRATTPGYTRPELAVLAAVAKIQLQGALLRSTVPDDPLVEAYLHDYVPAEIRDRFPAAVAAHRLRREIIATALANDCVDRMGAAFAHEHAVAAGADLAAVVRAWRLAWSVIDGDRLAEAITGARLDVEAESHAALSLANAVTPLVARCLVPTGATEAPTVDALCAALAPLRDGLPEWLAGGELQAHHRRLAELELQGFSSDVARALALIDWVPSLLDLTRAAALQGVPARTTASGYFAWAEQIDFAWLLSTLAALDVSDPWMARASARLASDVHDLRLTLARIAPASVPGLERVRRALRDVASTPAPSLAALLVLVHDLRSLAATVHKGD